LRSSPACCLRCSTAPTPPAWSRSISSRPSPTHPIDKKRAGRGALLVMPFVLKSSTVCFDCEAAAKRRAEDCFLPDLDRTPGPALATGSPFTRRPQASPTGGHCHQRPCCRHGQAFRVPWTRDGGGLRQLSQSSRLRRYG